MVLASFPSLFRPEKEASVALDVVLALHECVLISHVKLSQEWALIQVNINPIEEI